MENVGKSQGFVKLVIGCLSMGIAIGLLQIAITGIIEWGAGGILAGAIIGVTSFVLGLCLIFVGAADWLGDW